MSWPQSQRWGDAPLTPGLSRTRRLPGALSPDEADLVNEVRAEVVYWGVVPVRARIGGTTFTTAMFPREETWFLPVKVAVRRAEGIDLGELVAVRLSVGR